jgi:hypothetical protein
VSLYVPTSANKKVYLYMTYKSTGKLNSFSNGVYKFFGLPEGGNELVLATETSSDVYSGDSVVWLSYNNFVFRPKINDELISRPNAATSYQSAVTFTRSHTNPFASEYNPNFARIDLPGSSVQSLSAGNLPSALQGLFTVMYELPQIDSVSKVEMLIGGNSGPLSGGVSNPYLSDGESSSEVGSSTLIYNENILFTFSSVNYANP